MRRAFMVGVVVGGVASVQLSCATEGDTPSGGAGPTSTSLATTAANTATDTSSTSSSTGSGDASSGSGAVCGDGVIEPGEDCEGFDFGGKTCADYGLAGGTLACNEVCGVVLSGCQPVESCNNQLDDDGDGDVDCDDADCATSFACNNGCVAPTLVPVPAALPCNNTGVSDLFSSSCMPGAGRDMVFQLVAPTTEPLLVKVDLPIFDAGLAIRTACDDPSSEVACTNASVTEGEQVILQAQSGQTYYVIVESITGESGFFQLSVIELLPESGCDDFVDDDEDGYVDCDDPDACQGSPLCTPGSGEVGSPCLDNPDCAASQGDPVCLQAFLGYANGYCSEWCDLASDDCPSGSSCYDLGISHGGVCLEDCTTSSDCRPGYKCVDHGLGSLVCDKPGEALCDDTLDNDGDLLVDCEDTSGCSTSPSCIPGPGAPGTPCQLHDECQASNGDPFCIDQFHFSYPGGYCSEFCDLSANDCPAGTACSSWVPFASGHGLCFVTCSGPADCPPGYGCQNDGFHMICAP